MKKGEESAGERILLVAAFDVLKFVEKSEVLRLGPNSGACSGLNNQLSRFQAVPDDLESMSDNVFSSPMTLMIRASVRLFGLHNNTLRHLTLVLAGDEP